MRLRAITVIIAASVIAPERPGECQSKPQGKSQGESQGESHSPCAGRRAVRAEIGQRLREVRIEERTVVRPRRAFARAGGRTIDGIFVGLDLVLGIHPRLEQGRREFEQQVALLHRLALLDDDLLEIAVV